MDTILLEKVSDICDNNYEYLKSLQNVKGVGVGYKQINGKETNELSIHVFVEKKLEEASIQKGNIVPKKYLGINTDVIEIGKPKLRGIFNKGLYKAIRPLEGGYSISADKSSILGSISCIVKREDMDSRNYSYYILSNNHVLANSNKLPIGTPILQPAYFDRGKYAVANLSQFVPIKYNYTKPYPINYVDAAIAKINNLNLVSSKVALVGNITGIANAIPGLKIKKIGRTTGLTKGVVKTINVNMDFDNDGGLPPSTYKGLILVRTWFWFGDSGSIILDEKNRAVAQLFAGTDNYLAICSDIKKVLNLLNVKLLI